MTECLRRGLCATLMVALIGAGLLSATLGAADLLAGEAMRAISSWRAASRHPDAGPAWERAQRQIDRALRLVPYHPELLNERARVDEWRSRQQSVSVDAAHDLVRSALLRYRDSLRLRPGWAYTWGNVALVKYRLDEIDAEFSNSLRRTAAYGAWEPAVQRAALSAGLAAWPRLDEPDRLVVERTLARGLRMQASNTLSLVIEHQQLEALRGLKK